MTENNGLNNGNGTNDTKRPGRNASTTLISIILVFVVVIVVFAVVNSGLYARTTNALEGWTGGGRGSCCSIGVPVKSDQEAPADKTPAFSSNSCCSIDSPAAGSIDQLSVAALDYYRANYGSTDNLEAIVDDFGCHQEITISRNGSTVKRFGYSNGTFYDLTP